MGLLNSFNLMSLLPSAGIVVWGFLWAAPLVVFGQSAYSPLEGEFSITRGLPGDQTHPRLSLNSTGGYVVWQDNVNAGGALGINARALNSSFSPVLQKTFAVSQPTAGDQENPDVQLLRDGGAVFVWQGGQPGAQDIYARFVSADGTFLSGAILANTYTSGQQANPVVASLSDGSVVVAWTSFGQDGSMLGVFAQRFAATGQKLGAEFPINQFASYNQKSPAIAALADGGFVVVWVSEQQRFENSVDIYGRRFSSSGANASNEFLINAGTNVCANPVICSTSGEAFVVAWSQMDVADPTNGWDVFVRPFAASGQPSDEPQRANTFTPRNQFAPQVCSIRDQCLVVWTSVGQDGDREGIYGRFFAGTSFSGDEFRVHTYLKSRQIHPAVSADSEKRFLVTWSTFVGGAPSFELLAQRYSSDQSLAQPPAPSVSALDAYQLIVSWPELAGYTNLSRYLIYVDSATVPIPVTNHYWVLTELAPSSPHQVRLAFELSDGRQSPPSEPGTGKTWARDSNFDGLPDDWQSFYWGNDPAKWPSRDADSDGDGATNLQEFLAGTDPTDPDSVLRVQVVSSAQGYRLTWNSQPGFVYQVRTSTDFRAWSDLGDARFAPGAVESIPLSSSESGAFYQIVRVR